MSGGERNRLILMGALLCMLVAFVVAGSELVRFAGGKRRPPSTEVAKGLPERWVREDVELGLDPALLGTIRDGSLEEKVRREPEAYAHFREKVLELNDHKIRWGRFLQPDPEALRANPAAHRGSPVLIVGDLISLEREAETPGSEIRGIIREADGTLYSFTAAIRGEEVEVGSRALLKGFFYKLLALPDPEEQGRYVETLHVIAPVLVEAYPDVGSVSEIDRDLLARGVKDGEVAPGTGRPDPALFELEPEPYFHLLAYVKGLSEKEREALAADAVKNRELLADPERFRGEPVELFGVLGYLKPFQIEEELGVDYLGENAIGQDYIWKGLLYDRAEENGALVIFASEPDGIAVHDLAKVRGFFFKSHLYYTQQDDVEVVPYVLAYDWEKFVVPDNPILGSIVWVVLILVVLITSFFLVVNLREARKLKELDRQRIARRKRQLGGAPHPTASGEER